MVNRIVCLIISVYQRLRNRIVFSSDTYDKNPLEDILISDDSDKAWVEFQQQLLSEFKTGKHWDFLNFELIKKTMFYEPQYSEFLGLKSSKYWSKIKKGIKEHPLGCPKPYHHYPLTSGNLVHHAYSLSILLEELDWNEFLKTKHVFEFGGGYGSFCRLLFNLGFDGQYTIYDLKPFSELQRWYLSQVVSGNNTIEYLSPGKSLITSDIDIFIALWSLSESPIEVRTNMISVIKKAKFSIIAFQDNFRGINNLEYFSDLMRTEELTNSQIISNKYLNGHYYFVKGSK